MRTLNYCPDQTLADTLFGKTRRAVLSLLYGHPDEAFYLRQIVRATGSGIGPVQRELRQLTGAGILRRTVQGHQVYFQANLESPVFSELKSLIVKTVGIGEILRNALSPLAKRIKIAFVYGSVAQGRETRDSDVDILIVGDVTFSGVVSVLQEAQETLGREVNPVVYPAAEFRSRITDGHYFLKNVVTGPKMFLIGDENELGRMGTKRLVDEPPDHPPGDRRTPAHSRP